MRRSRWVRGGLFLSTVSAASLFAATALAQMDVDEEGYFAAGGDEGTTGEYYGDSDPRHGAGSLDEARARGGSIRLGSGQVPSSAVPDVYTVRRGDTLWDITGRFYGNPWQWPRVWSYNPEVTNPHWIYPDDRLRLTSPGTAQVRLAGGEGGDGGSQPGPTQPTGRGTLQPGSVVLRDQGYLDDEALEASGEIVGSPADHMLLTAYDDVYVRFDEDDGVQPGMELTIFRRVDDADRNPDEEGELVRIFGTVRLRSYDPDEKLGRGQITEALDPIERGFEVANVARRFEMVPPSENQQNLDAEVVAALRPLQLFGNYQVVFVNVGEEQGVRQGNRFFIVRSEDSWRDSLTTSERTAGQQENADEPEEYPDEIVAEGRVVNVRPTTAGLIITRAVAEVEIGDRAEMRAGY